mgnify:FL=1
MSNFVKQRSQWTRCHTCGHCNYIVWKPSKVYPGGTYNSTGCKICQYTWSKGVLTNALLNTMKSQYRIETGKGEDELEEPIKFMLNLFSKSHCPEVIRECYQAAAAEFMTTFTRMWARNLQSRARNR